MLRLRFAILVAVVAVIAHDATYLIGHGLNGYPAALGIRTLAGLLPRRPTPES